MNTQTDLPIIIQGGMGAGVSNWKLARTVSELGQLGVVSGTGINTLMIRRLQDGDQGGHTRRALANFPDQALATKTIETFFLPEGRAPGEKYKLSPLPSVTPSIAYQQLTALASFVEVYLAKENHEGLVGINLLEKLQTSGLPAIYGAMLASVDYILMGAGIPREIPGVIDHFTRNEEASIKATVTGANATTPETKIRFSPTEVFPLLKISTLKKPKFLAIISSSTLATHLAKKTTGTLDGFVVEAPTAGGHNAPPRGALKLNENGEPIYGVKDDADIAAIQALGLPFWLAGAYGSPEKLKEAQSKGAVGIQVGTAFAFCEESGLADDLKKAAIKKWALSDPATLEPVFTDPLASPTDFPFKVAPIKGTLSEAKIYEERPRICDLGYLRQNAIDEQGKIIYRCASEPIDDYLKKGGKIEETVGRKCLCNALMANVGVGQLQNNQYQELGLVTAGDDLIQLRRFLTAGKTSYPAADVIKTLLS